MTNYVQINDQLRSRLAAHGEELTGTIASFARLNRLSLEAGALDAKTKELMALAISIVLRCDNCITYHVRDSVNIGATRRELIETLGVALMMGGEPSTVYVTQAMDAIDQYLPPPAPVQLGVTVEVEFDPYNVNAD